MIPGFERQWSGQSPHYEVWYGKVDVEPGVALWFRYTILDGATREASTWAVVFVDGQTRGGRGLWSPEDLRRTGDRDDSVFAIGDEIRLDARSARGHAGDIRWELSWTDSGRRFGYLPHAFFDLGLVGSTYDACLLDLRVTGTVSFDGRTVELSERPGMIGHIQGKKVIATRWGWAHCNSFREDPDAVFEGFSPKLLVAGRPIGPLGMFVLYSGGERYTFRSPRVIFGTSTSFDRDGWTFRTRSGGVTLRGEARAPKNVALVEYTDTDDSHLWCYNSKLADLTLTFSDSRRGIDRVLTANGTAAYEHVTRERPAEEPLI